mgnify:CR=1 FL=1
MENRTKNENDMSFNNERYALLKTKVKLDIDLKVRVPYDFMILYERSVVNEDYEYCKAITEVLALFGYNTADTHKHIKSLN